MTKISRSQVEAALALLKAKVELQRRFVQSLKERGYWERAFLRKLGLEYHWDGELLERYIKAHGDHYQAQVDMAAVILSELESQLSINEAMLKEAENPTVVVPSGIVRPT
jgi:hypothetical protein